VAAKQVGGGEALIGFTDSDDAAVEQREGLPLAKMPITEESLILHNTAGVIRGAPHPETAEKLFEYIQSAEVQNSLLEKRALESAVPGDPNTNAGLKVDWDALIKDLDKGTEEMKAIFLR
jgi:ABC-type Fe3+ transport system substrate-binding protein